MDAVLQARSLLDARRAELYPKCKLLKKLAATSDSAALADSAHQLLDRADMVIATDFDIVHLEAQIRHRTATQQGDLAGIQEILDAVLGRNAEAKEQLPDVERAVKAALAALGE